MRPQSTTIVFITVNVNMDEQLPYAIKAGQLSHGLFKIWSYTPQKVAKIFYISFF